MFDSGLHVYQFGAPRVQRDGEALSFGRQKGIALLSVLCADPQRYSREKLLDILWPLFGPDDGRNNLRRELSLLRGVLGSDLILADRMNVALEPAALADGRLSIDSIDFDRHVERVRQHDHADGNLCSGCANELTAAAALYYDDFLAGFSLPDSIAFDEWQFFRREHYRDAAASVFRRLAAWHEGRGEYDTALGYARRWLAFDALLEPAHRALMRLYELAGQHSAALHQYETLVRALHDELGIAPEAESAALYHTIKSRQMMMPAGPEQPVPASEPRRPPHNLPADTTPFIGREQELAAIDALLAEPGVRLITIMGMGGIGKTRLALASAARQLDRANGSGLTFPDGVFLVALAPLEKSSQIVAAIARAVDFSFHGEHDQTRQLSDFLRSRRLLLLFDNFEHLIDPTSVGLVVDLLNDAPGVNAIVTSRMRLGTRAEQLYPLGGLDVPDASVLDFVPACGMGELDSPNAALALFCQSARRVQPEFTFDELNLPSALRVCQLVHGMPLGIELATAWLEILRVDEIVAEIERSLDFLEVGWHDLPERQTSLRVVFDTSWKLLTPLEQVVLMSLTIFRGSFSRNAAEQVAGASLKLLLSLRMKSWLQLVEQDRYQIHELLRQYAAGELRAVPDGAERLHREHALYFSRYLQDLEPRMRGRKPGAAYLAVEQELDNVQAALDWLIDHDEICVIVGEMLPALFRYLESRYRYFIFQPQLQRAQERAELLGLTQEAGVLLVAQGAFFFNGYPTRYMDYHWVWAVSLELLNRALATLPTEPTNYGFWSILLAWQYGRFTNVENAVSRLRFLIAHFREKGRRWEMALTLQCLGRLLTPRPWESFAYTPGGEGRASLDEALVLFRELGDEREEAVTLLFLGFESQTAGDMTKARELAKEAQSRLREMGDDIIAVMINWNLAEIHLQLGEVEDSLRMFHELADAYIRAGRPHLAIDGLSRESYEAVRYGNLQYALQLRERSLALSRAASNLDYESWDTWEMGEIYRVLGDLTQARAWFDRSLSFFKPGGTTYAENDVGLSFFHRGLGDVALVRGDPVEAKDHFIESRRYAEATNHVWQYAYVVTRLGEAFLQAAELDEACRHLADGLRAGLGTGDPGLILVTFAAAARLYHVSGNSTRSEWAAEIVLAHQLAWNEKRTEMMQLLGLTQADADRRRRPKPFDLTTAVGELLAELEKNG